MFKQFIRKFFSEKGQALIETVLIITLVSLTAVGALSAAGVSLNNVYTNIAEKCEGGDTPTDPYDIAGCSIGAIEDQTYTGAAIEPAITVTTSEGTALTQDTDFTAEYENNTDVGLATVTINGTGDWHGSKSAEFNIVSVTIENVPSASKALVYNGSKQSPVWNNYDEAQLEIGGVTEGTDAAMYTATFTPKAGYTWADGSTTSKNVKWEIMPLALGGSNVTAECADIEWEGGTLESPVTLKMNGSTLPSTLYKVTYLTSTPKTESPYDHRCTANVQPADGNSNVVGSKAVYYTVARKSYTVSYDANSGSGAPSSQTKYYGVSLTLSSTKPTRSGYDFLGWSTSSTATSASYAAGASYTTNGAATLYAVWKQSLQSILTAAGISATVSGEGDTVWIYATSLKWDTVTNIDRAGPSNSKTNHDGKTNTDWMLNPANTNLGTTEKTIWKFCQDVRTATGDNKWYIPSAAELKARYDAGTYRPNNYTWSSSEDSDHPASGAYYLSSSGSICDNGGKGSTLHVALFHAP